MNILFCGTEIKGNFIQEISKKDQITYTGSYNHAAEYEEIIFNDTYDVIMFDVSDLIDDSVIIKDYIKRVEIAKTCKIIVVAAGYTYKSKLINLLISAGIVNYILGTGLATQYDEYEKCLSGYYKENGLEQVIKEEEEERVETEKEFACKSIGVAGIMPRIGTTTICLQLIKYIMQKGYKAAYVEVNTTSYIDRSEELYADIEKDREDRYLIYNGIKMYKGSRLQDALNEKYDYLVFDYGSILDPSFNKISFAEKCMKIFVAGSKPNEFDQIQPVLQSQVYTDAKYVFNFVPDGDKKDLLDMMCEKAHDTIFSIYTPDPFDYVSNKDYEKILPLDQKLEIVNDEKKRFFTFPMLRKAGKNGEK